MFFSFYEFLEELERLNYSIVEELKTSVKDKIRVITRRQCRDPNKENWILQAPAQINKWFIKKQTIHFDLLTVYHMYRSILIWPCASNAAALVMFQSIAKVTRLVTSVQKPIVPKSVK